MSNHDDDMMNSQDIELNNDIDMQNRINNFDHV